jgi:geranylgeranyl pyrophosphate synthase
LEILGEYEIQLRDDILKFLRSKKTLGKITKATLKENSVVVSAVTRYGIEDFLDKVIDVFQGLNTSDVYHISDEGRGTRDAEQEVAEDMIMDVTNEDKQFLIDNNYMDAKLLQHVKIWQIKNREICKLVRMLPW